MKIKPTYQELEGKIELLTQENQKVFAELIKKNEELQVTEMELRAFNEELITTSEALKKSNEQLIIANEKAEESSRLKTEFLNNMSHEIRTPLNGIIGFTEFISKPNLTEEKRQQFAKIIKSSSNQLLRIIDDILEISKLGTSQVEINEIEICLNDVLLDLFSIFDVKAKEKKIPLYLKKGLSDKASTIFVDSEKLQKVLHNLLENALKFTNEGFIDFGYRICADSFTETSLNDNPQLVVYVKDTGIGISESKKDIIFDKFSQEEKTLSRNVGGLGLGLSIAKENVALFGGTITLESEKGEGSTFFVTIPYNPVYTTIDSNKQEKESDKYIVLIAEDEEVNYLYLETLLIEEFEFNCEIIHAKNGKEAIEECKNNTDIDLILMDLKMPIMNGFEAARVIKEFRKDLPIIAQTAYSTPFDKQKAISAGCDNFISKPIRETVLKSIINEYLGILLK